MVCNQLKFKDKIIVEVVDHIKYLGCVLKITYAMHLILVNVIVALIDHLDFCLGNRYYLYQLTAKCFQPRIVCGLYRCFTFWTFFKVGGLINIWNVQIHLSVVSSCSLFDILVAHLLSRKIFLMKYNNTDLFNQDSDVVLSKLYFNQEREH